MTADERTQHARKAAQGRRFGAMRRRCEAATEHLSEEQLEALARILAPWAYRA